MELLKCILFLLCIAVLTCQVIHEYRKQLKPESVVTITLYEVVGHEKIKVFVCRSDGWLPLSEFMLVSSNDYLMTFESDQGWQSSTMLRGVELKDKL